MKLASTFICSEAMLFERLQSLTQRRTAVYISHRFSTVRRADRILFLEHGELVEAGTHEELIGWMGAMRSCSGCRLPLMLGRLLAP